uniref:Uncharacterized protein n=1 Tax=Pyxicephalus adspersus TaxID=30357 RepID=A0AAV3AVP8_PYXAD|nr:TPA: hypothetical protein GDO54_007577 [Pyxicephalus adspersus]
MTHLYCTVRTQCGCLNYCFGGLIYFDFSFIMDTGWCHKGSFSFESSATGGTCCTVHLVMALISHQLISPHDASGRLELLCNMLEGPLAPARGGRHRPFLSTNFAVWFPIRSLPYFLQCFYNAFHSRNGQGGIYLKHFVASLFSFARVFLNSSFKRYVPSQNK